MGRNQRDDKLVRTAIGGDPDDGVATRPAEPGQAVAEARMLLQRNQGLLMNSVDGIHVMDVEGNIVEANDAFCRMLGYTREEMLGLNVTDWNAQWTAEDLQAKFTRLIGKSARFETVHHRKDGTRIDVEISTSSVEVEGQHLFFAASRDITSRKQMERELARSRELFSTMFKLAGVGIARVALDGHWLDVNQKLCDIAGYSCEELLALTFQDITHPDDLEADHGYVRGLLAGDIPSCSMEKRYLRKDGAVVWVAVSAVLVRDDEGAPDYFIAVIEDVTRRRQADDMLRRHKVVIDTALDGFWMNDPAGYLLEANEAYARISGYSIGELVGMHISQLEALEQSPEKVRVHCEKIIAQGYDRFETRHRRKDGHEIDVEVSVTYLPDSQQFFAFSRDISERKRAESEIHDLAFYDALTGLPNRRLFLDRFHAALSVSARYKSYGALLFLDLDNFKALNDTFGHDRGDLMLVEVAARIRSCVREMDTAARFGGDEFVVLVEEVSDDRDEVLRKVGLVAEKIREALARPYHLGGHDHQGSPSIGISLYCGNEATVDALLRQADLSMYQAKHDGGNRVRFFGTT
ncbi:MAG: PAS domain S-box protein [Sideroxyarcus sp.]|nr:PAS domain S-box protein [Sideroxyarcus sp.]